MSVDNVSNYVGNVVTQRFSCCFNSLSRDLQFVYFPTYVIIQYNVLLVIALNLGGLSILTFWLWTLIGFFFCY